VRGQRPAGHRRIVAFGRSLFVVPHEGAPGRWDDAIPQRCGNHPTVPPVSAQDVTTAAEHAQVAVVVRAVLPADDVVDVRYVERQ